MQIKELKKIKPSMKWVLPDTHPILRKKSEECVLPLSSEDEDYLEKMISYVDASYNGEYEKYNIRPGVAIASNQVGWLKRVIYLHFDDEDGNEVKLCLINPKIKKNEDKIICLSNGEGCLSVPEDHKGIVPRSDDIEVEAYDLFNDKYIKLNWSGYKAIVIQHEIDHLNGILYYDHINVLDPNFINKNWKKL